MLCSKKIFVVRFNYPKTNEILMMLYVYFYGHLLLAVWIGFLKVRCLEDVPIVNRNTGDITDETTHNGNSMDINGAEVEDVYDEYMKVIIYNGLQFRNAVENKQKIWDDGIVPYVISDEYSKDNKDLILESVEEFHNKTCVQFQQRKNETSYILLEPGSGCSAVVGKLPNNANRVTLHENCFVKGIVLHELMHALGFVHEQNRPDRDEFVTIDFDNIRNGSVINFNKYSDNELHMFNQTYDYESVMHYGPHDFAENKSKPTIVPIKKGVKIGQRKGFSEKDLIKINLLYNCNGAGDDVYHYKGDPSEKQKSRDVKKL